MQVDHGVTTESVHRVVPFAAHLGVEFEALTPDEVVAVLPERPEFRTVGAAVHGGAQLALADMAAAVLAVLASGDSTAWPATATSAATFLRPARGELRARATALRTGRSAVVDVAVTDRDGALCSVVRQTVVVRPAE